MRELAFTIKFHTPFRVGAAYARDGVAAAVDHDDPLPGDHLKGVMRAAADQLFGRENHPVVLEVFGAHRTPTPWSWSRAIPAEGGGWKIGRRHRVRIDETTHAARKDHLVLGEQAYTPEARFTVTRIGMMPEPPYGTLTEDEHVLVLRCAAAGVHGLGAWRRRGLGWVGVTPEKPEEQVTAGDIRALLSLAEARA